MTRPKYGSFQIKKDPDLFSDIKRRIIIFSQNETFKNSYIL